MRFPLIVSSSLIAAALLAAPAVAQRDFSDVEVTVEQVAPGVAVLMGAGGNIGVSYGPDGTVLVDDQFAPLTEKIQAAVAGMGADPVRFLINTHWHGDHTGGNENFGQAGALIMAQEHVRDRMASEQDRGNGRITPPSPAAALPVVTYYDGIKLHLNGSIVRTIHVPHAHTDGDSIVHFVDANVIHMGDTFFHQMSLPYIDLASGGSAKGLLAAVHTALELANDDTVIIPGHGPVATRADLVAYRAMVAEVIMVVENGRAAGQSLEEIIALKPAARWDTNPQAFIKGDAFVTTIYESLGNSSHHHSEEHSH